MLRVVLACLVAALQACLDFGGGWTIGNGTDDPPDPCDGTLYAQPIGLAGSIVRLAPNAPLTVDGVGSLSGRVVPEDLVLVLPALTGLDNGIPDEEGLRLVGLRTGMGELRVADVCGRTGKYPIEVVAPATTSVALSYSAMSSGPLDLAPESIWLAPGCGWVIGATSQSADGKEILLDTIVEGDSARFVASNFSDSDRRLFLRGAETTGPLDLMVNGIPLSIGVQAPGEGIDLVAVDDTGTLADVLEVEVGQQLRFGLLGRTAEGRVVPLCDGLPFRSSSSEPSDGESPIGGCLGLASRTHNPWCDFEFQTQGSRILAISRDNLTGAVEVRVR